MGDYKSDGFRIIHSGGKGVAILDKRTANCEEKVDGEVEGETVMEVVVTTAAIRHAKPQSNHHHQHTNTQLFTGWMPFLSPNQQCQSTEGKQLLSVNQRY